MMYLTVGQASLTVKMGCSHCELTREVERSACEINVLLFTDNLCLLYIKMGQPTCPPPLDIWLFYLVSHYCMLNFGRVFFFRIGRRWTQSLLLLIAGVACLSWALLHETGMQLKTSQSDLWDKYAALRSAFDPPPLSCPQLKAWFNGQSNYPTYSLLGTCA